MIKTNCRLLWVKKKQKQKQNEEINKCNVMCSLVSNSREPHLSHLSINCSQQTSSNLRKDKNRKYVNIRGMPSLNFLAIVKREKGLFKLNVA